MLVTDSRTPFPIGTLVEHPKRPEWGPGKVLVVEGSKVKIYFRDLPEKTLDDAVKTIDISLAALREANSQTDPQLDNLPPYDEGFKSKRPRLSPRDRG